MFNVLQPAGGQLRALREWGVRPSVQIDRYKP